MTHQPVDPSESPVKIISRAEAKALGLKRYATGRPCKRGHTSERLVSCCKCRACDREDRVARREYHLARNLQYRNDNPEYFRRKRREWYAAHREYRREMDRQRLEAGYFRAHYAKNRERYQAHVRNRRARLQEAGGTHSPGDIADILRMQKRRCALPWCRASLSKGYHVDHITPVSKGGSNDRRNLQCLCQKCNVRKSAKDPIDFAQANGRLL